MARIRTIPKAVEELKEKDPGTCVNVWNLRHWVKTGAIPSITKGRQWLIDMNALEAFLENAYADR